MRAVRTEPACPTREAAAPGVPVGTAPAAAWPLRVMSSRPRELGRVQVVQSAGGNGRLQFTLLSAAGVSINLVPRVPGEVVDVMQALGNMVLCDAHDEERRAAMFLDAVCCLQRFARSVAVHRWWHQLYYRVYCTAFGFGVCRFRPLARVGQRPEWWWPNRGAQYLCFGWGTHLRAIVFVAVRRCHIA